MEKIDNTFVGIISIHPRGFGFVNIQQTEKSFDIFIPRKVSMRANTGDTVKVLCTNLSEKGYDGEVIEVLTRKENSLTGYVRAIKGDGNAYLYVPHLGFKQNIILIAPQISCKIKHGDVLKVNVLDWGDKDDIIYCKLDQRLGSIFDPQDDVKAISSEFKIASEFSPEVIEELAQINGEIIDADREDLRHLKAITIDPCGARDFDDAISLEIDSNNNYSLGVHIADVAHYVKKNSCLDIEASQRSNSTYLIDRCIPMLPSKLSNGLCSLKSGEDRYAASVIMTFDKTGNLLSHKIKRSVIHCQHGFTYKQAREILESKGSSKVKTLLKQLKSLALSLKNKRISRGSVDLAISELKLHLDKKGNIIDLEKIEYDITHQMIEEFMLKTNEIVATHLTRNEKALTYRIHPEPLGSDFANLITLAKTVGYKLDQNPSPHSINSMLKKLKEHPMYSNLVITFIKSLPFAYYSPDNVGHYGLGLGHYCHFTSPIRRYSDLVVQRILFDEYHPNIDELKEISQECSTKERNSGQAEEKLKSMKKLRYLKSAKKQDKNKTYTAIISKVNSSGIIFEVEELMFEGFLHISRLGRLGRFNFDHKTLSLRATESKTVFSIGQKIEVALTNVDLITQEARWDICQ